jgi:acyl-coenzyme A synthetase/AMP-(fatty) acid ligase
MEQPEIVEAAVVGEPDRVRGEIPVAYVVLRDASFDHQILLERCKQQLSSFKVPKRVEIVPQLPRNALGKVQKHLLCRAS